MPRISFVPVPLSVSLLCDDLTAVLCWEGHAQERPQALDSYTTSTACAAMPIEPSPSLTVP